MGSKQIGRTIWELRNRRDTSLKWRLVGELQEGGRKSHCH